MSPLHTQHKDINHYKDDLDSWSKRYQKEGFIWGETPSECSHVLLNDLKPHSRVLEIGCGYGRDTKAILEQEHFVVALDKAVVGTALAQERLKSYIDKRRAEIIHADFLDAHIPDGYFDAVMSHRVLHLMKPTRVPEIIKRIADSLKSGGKLVLSARSPKDFNELQMKWIDTDGTNDNTTAVYRSREDHIINFYDKQRLTVLLKKRFTKLSFVEGEEIEACTNIDDDGHPTMSQYILVTAEKG